MIVAGHYLTREGVQDIDACYVETMAAAGILEADSVAAALLNSEITLSACDVVGAEA